MNQNKFLSSIQVKMPGIYGGMGPMSHIVFEQALVAECKKRKITNDQDYPVWIVASGSSTPDRTKSIEGGENSLSHMIHFSQLLEKSGSDFIVMICNTAHYYLSSIKQSITIPVISIISETVNHIKNTNPRIKRVGLLATDGTLSTKIYETELTQSGFETISFPLNSGNQKSVMDAIYNKDYGVKATGNKQDNRAVEILSNSVKVMINHGSELVIAGCTEISIALKKEKYSVPIVDPIGILAERVVDLALGTTKQEADELNKGKIVQSSNFPFYNFPNETAEEFLEF